MTDTTPRAGAPLLAANQAQKNVTHNEALYQFDAFLCARFLDRDLSAPPPSPADGDTYLVHATGTGAWTGQDGKVAYCADGTWRFYAPFAGLIAFVADEAKLIVFSGGAWIDIATLMEFQNLPMLGVNTTASSANKLAVQSNAVLFGGLGTASGGTGDIRAALSKQASGNTASLLFQDNFSGRAEVGLTGDDNFHIKVSPDGTSWNEAMRILSANGHIAIGPAAPAAAAVASVHISQAANAPPAALASSTDTVLVTAEDNAALHFISSSNTASSRYSVIAHRARGNFASLAAAQSGDKLFGFIGGGYDGTAFQNGALLEFICDSAPSSGHVPTRISLTTGTNSTDRVERMTVTSAGLVGINATPAVQLDVGGPVRVGQYTVSTLPSAAVGAGQIVYVSNESGGAVLAFSDGGSWRRVTDRTVVS